jgi:hypothetical protein
MDQKLIATSPPDLERAVQHHEERPQDAEQDVEVEPPRERAQPPQRTQALAHGIEVHDRHHDQTGHAEPQAQRPARLEGPVERMAGPLFDGRQVIGAPETTKYAQAPSPAQ